jgi:hypothetical protein
VRARRASARDDDDDWMLLSHDAFGGGCEHDDE